MHGLCKERYKFVESLTLTPLEVPFDVCSGGGKGKNGGYAAKEEKREEEFLDDE